jgi:hypothetical protein
MALVLAIMFVVVARDIELGLHRVAAVHLQPLVISGVVIAVGMTLKASLPDIPGPVLLAITFVVLLASLLPVLLQKRRVIGFFNVAHLRRTEGGV